MVQSRKGAPDVIGACEELEITRGIRGPKKIWREIIRQEMAQLLRT